jgi:hypothetical protein
MAGKPSHPTTALRLSKHLACLCHACCFGASSVAPLSPRRVTTRLCCRSLFLGTYGTRHNVAPPLGLYSSYGTRLSPPCRACLPRSFRFARRSCAMLRHARAHAPALPPSYSVVKSFPALPIQQSKAVTISLSVGYGSAILSESSRLRLHPAHLACLKRP